MARPVLLAAAATLATCVSASAQTPSNGDGAVAAFPDVAPEADSAPKPQTPPSSSVSGGGAVAGFPDIEQPQRVAKFPDVPLPDPALALLEPNPYAQVLRAFAEAAARIGPYEESLLDNPYSEVLLASPHADEVLLQNPYSDPLENPYTGLLRRSEPSPSDR